jgi:hypothetical protein
VAHVLDTRYGDTIASTRAAGRAGQISIFAAIYVYQYAYINSILVPYVSATCHMAHEVGCSLYVGGGKQNDRIIVCYMFLETSAHGLSAETSRGCHIPVHAQPISRPMKHPVAKGCTDDGTLAIVPIYIPILD